MPTLPTAARRALLVVPVALLAACSVHVKRGASAASLAPLDSATIAHASVELMQADRDFQQAYLARRGDGWADFYAADGVEADIDMAGPALHGQDAVRASARERFADTTRTLRWEPLAAGLWRDRTHGFTQGRWRSVVRAADGTETEQATGHYLTIWRREADGRWKVILDTGVADRK